MSRLTLVCLTGCPNLTRSHYVAIRALALCALNLVPVVSQATAPGIVLWNKLGSTSEVLNSDYGPNLGFFNSPSFVDVVGNPDYVPGVFGNGLSIGPGSYYSQAREHTVVWSGVDQYLNPDRGTISVWYKQNSNPVNFDHGVYRLFDGPYGLSTGIGLWTQSSFPSPGPPTLNFGMDFGGTVASVAYDSSSLNGPWIHVAGVWDRDGIDNTSDTLRLYINGNVVASTASAGWGTTVGQFADIAGGNDQNIAGQFAIDNLKVYNVAITDFSDRFTEGIPEPASACLMLAGAALLGSFRTTRRAPPSN